MTLILNEEQAGFRVIRAMYWAGVRAFNKKVTIDQVGNWLQEEIENGKGIEELFEPITKALQVSGLLGDLEDAKEDEEKN